MSHGLGHLIADPPPSRLPRDAVVAALRWWTSWCLRRPAATVAVCAVLALLAIVATTNTLRSSQAIWQLPRGQDEVRRRWQNYQMEFGDQEDVVVVVRGDGPQAIVPALRGLAARLAERRQKFSAVYGERDLQALSSKRLHFLSAADWEPLAASVTEALEMAQQGAAVADPPDALRLWNAAWEQEPATTPEMIDRRLRQAQQLAGGLLPALSAGAPSAHPLGPPPVWPALTTAEKTTPLLSADQKTGYVLLRVVEDPRRPAMRNENLRDLQTLLADARREFPQTEFFATGFPILEHDHRSAAFIDVLLLPLLAWLGGGVVLWAILGSLRPVVVAGATSAIAAAWMVGAAAVITGAVGSAAVPALLLVLGLSWALSGRYLLRSFPCDSTTAEGTTSAWQDAVERDGPGIAFAALSLVLVGVLTTWIEFIPLAEWGVWCAVAGACCLATTLSLVPSGAVLFDNLLGPADDPPATEATSTPRLLPVGSWLVGMQTASWGMVLVSAFGIAALCAGVSKLRWDDAPWFGAATPIAGTSTCDALVKSGAACALAICDGREEALAQRERFERLPTVARVEEMASLAPIEASSRSRTIARWQELLTKLPPLHQETAWDLAALQTELQQAAERLRTHGWENSPAARAVEQLRQATAGDDPAETQRRLLRYQAGLRGEIARRVGPLREVCDPVPPTWADLPRPLAERFVGRSQKSLLKIYPRASLADGGALRQFVAELETVDPLVTGHPVLAHYATRRMLPSFLTAILLLLPALGAAAYVRLGSWTAAGLACASIICLVAPLLGIMGWCGQALGVGTLGVWPLVAAWGTVVGTQAVAQWQQRRSSSRAEQETQALAAVLPFLLGMVCWSPLLLSQRVAGVAFGQGAVWANAGALALAACVYPAIIRWITTDEAATVESQTQNAARPVPAPHVRPRRIQADHKVS